MESFETEFPLSDFPRVNTRCNLDFGGLCRGVGGVRGFSNITRSVASVFNTCVLLTHRCPKRVLRSPQDVFFGPEVGDGRDPLSLLLFDEVSEEGSE